MSQKQNVKETTEKTMIGQAAPAKEPEPKKSVMIKVRDKVRNVVVTIETNPVGRVVIKGTKTALYGLGLWKGAELLHSAIKPKQTAAVILTEGIEPETETEDEVDNNEIPAEAVEEDITEEHD